MINIDVEIISKNEALFDHICNIDLPAGIPDDASEGDAVKRVWMQEGGQWRCPELSRLQLSSRLLSIVFHFEWPG